MIEPILCIETSGKPCSVALSSLGESKVSLSTNGDWQHSKYLALLIKEVCDNAKISIKDLVAVAISKGPGSYTGLRVGTSAAKAICYSFDIPLIAVPTLEILAFPHIKEAEENSALIVPMIDARRQEVYYNVYNKDLTPTITTTNLVLESNSFKDYQAQNLIIVGDGAEKAKDLLKGPNLTFKPTIVSAAFMPRLAYGAFKAEKIESTAYFTPFYLKPPNITKSKKSLF